MTKMSAIINLTYIKVARNEGHINDLYTLLVSRIHNISNCKIPDYEDHKEFVFNNPYRAWYLIKNDGKLIGSVYIQNDNSIGLCLMEINEKIMQDTFRWLKTRYRPLPPIRSVRAADFFMNIPSTNDQMKNALAAIGAIPLQISYSLKNI